MMETKAMIGQSPLLKTGRAFRNHYPVKYSFIFLLLGLFAVLFMLYNIDFNNQTWLNLKPTTVSPVTTMVPTKKTPNLMTITTTKPTQPASICSFNSVSPKDAREIKLLKESIAWPETPPVPSNFSLKDSSHPAHSTFNILPLSASGGWHVGDQLQVLIKICDFQGRPKKSGGDVLLARLHNSALSAGVVGKVLDHHNGSYTAIFLLLWEGRAQVEVILVHPSEGVTLLEKLTQQEPDRVYFKSFFRSGSITESVTCNLCLNAPKQQLCNYTDLHTGEPWFCFKPKKLNCDSRITHSKGGFKHKIAPLEKQLFQKGVNLKVSIPALGSASISILPKPKDRIYQGLNTSLAGYYYQGTWRALDGTTVRQFDNATAITQCLKGKVVHLYGDSTIRQWFEYLITTTPGLKKFDLKSQNNTGPFLALDYKNNILVTYRLHGPPIRFNLPLSQTRYITSELKGVVGGPNSVVIIGVWAHFSTFPIEVYIQRMLNIRRALVQLLMRAPGTLVIIRTANPKALKLYETLTVSDWYSLQRDKVLRAIFKGVNVQLVDAWEMTLAHQLPHNLHPEPPIIKNMMDVVFSNICPPHHELETGN